MTATPPRSDAVPGPARPIRADAARNRARVLEVAYETFAAEGIAVPIDEIARRAGVGPGTIYRHFPTKDALFEAVITDRVRVIAELGRTLLAREPATALFEFLRAVVRTSLFDRGLADALERYGVDFETAVPGAEATFLQLTDELLGAAQRAGTVRSDVGTAELKALLMVCKSSGDPGDGVSERVADVIVDGLRAR